MNARRKANNRNPAVNYRKIMKIAVLSGGNGAEREVSLKSGIRVAEALRRNGHAVAIIDPTSVYEEKEMQFQGEHRTAIGRGSESPCSICKKTSRCRKKRNRRSTAKPIPRIDKSREFTESSIKFCRKADIVFMALHGGAGEDGRIAAALECMGIRHTGSGHKGLCISMDKLISKRLFLQASIPTPCFCILENAELPQLPPRPDADNNSDKNEYHGELPHLPPLPCVIKPINGGSSIGVEIVGTEAELQAVLTGRKDGDEPIIIEKRIIGREFTVGILRGNALAVTEIIPKSGFYDYENK